MPVHGFITHAAHNRRLTTWLVAAYMAAFQLIAIFVLTWFLLLIDHEHTVLSDPFGYAVRYAVPVAIMTGLLFWWVYSDHARVVCETLGVRLVDRSEEPRFVAIAEEQCTALGVRLPRFGIVEVAEPNALSAGEGPDRGLIAVTRGLLDQLDDDELAAVLAHEASHIRQGDTKVLAANHALMRTAVLLQTNNPLRIEDWRQLIIPLALPAMLPLFLVSGAVTHASLRLARFARRGLKLTRDHVADGEAIRVTHFPEALVTALEKVSGRGGFEGSDRVEAMLFDGQTDYEGGSHPSVHDRVNSIGELGASLFEDGRSRRDTRTGSPVTSGSFDQRRVQALRHTGPVDPPSFAKLLLFFTDQERYWKWQNANTDFYEWREGDGRNFFGISPKLAIPTAALTVALVVFYWPADGDLTKLAQRMGPGALVEMARQVHSGPFCSGPSYPDGKCHKTAQR